ncbi:MAG: DUF3043 domain-containing protein [Cryobacterium sp.]|nr:DUF3043 domain-containing protein [Micrococcales bacterium]MBX3079620.1 DUF3043 domain-containing protein [Cryobacterium sp.]MBX3310858.1 DUF3043 domain-containing protein [Cryobacterium sp.]
MAKAEKRDERVDVDPATDGASPGKGRPTPTRKEREAANLRPLVGNDRRAATKESRMKMAEVRERARIGMAAGEEKYLPLRDKGPQRRWIRDYVDARFSVGEVLIPVMFVVIILTFVSNELLQLIGIAGLWLFFLAAVIDGVILGMLVNRRLSEKFGADKVQRGNRWYAAMRGMQLRVMRLPKPQVKRGQFPV